MVPAGLKVLTDRQLIPQYYQQQLKQPKKLHYEVKSVCGRKVQSKHRKQVSDHMPAWQAQAQQPGAASIGSGFTC